MFPTPSAYFLSTLRLLLITTMVATGCSGSGNSGAPATASDRDPWSGTGRRRALVHGNPLCTSVQGIFGRGR